VKTFIIERELPGASRLSDEELNGIAQASCDTIEELGRPYRWLHSYVAGDKLYCVHAAETPEDVREHASTGGFPLSSVTEVSRVLGSSGVREMPS
jgi:hypothetical protein